MKALILKDFYNLGKQMKTILIVLVCYGVFGIVTSSSSFLTGMITIFCAILPISSFSYDDFSKWDSYALSLPIPRSQIVLSKYVFSILMIILGCFLAFAFNIITSFFTSSAERFSMSDTILSIGLCGMLCVLITSILLPIIVKVGVEKGRLAMFAVFFIPSILVVLLIKRGVHFPEEATIERMLPYLSVFLAVVIFLLFLTSYFISLSFYKKKEF